MDTLHEDRRTFTVISRRIFLRIRTLSEIDFRGNQTIHFMFNKRFPESVYEKMWKKVAEPDIPQRII
jgi:hypothetical protein